MLRKQSRLCKLTKSNTNRHRALENNYRLRALEIITSSHKSINSDNHETRIQQLDEKTTQVRRSKQKTWCRNRNQRSQSKQIKKMPCTNSADTPQKNLKPDELTRILFNRLLNLCSGYHHKHGRLSHNLHQKQQEDVRTKNSENVRVERIVSCGRSCYIDWMN